MNFHNNPQLTYQLLPKHCQKLAHFSGSSVTRSIGAVQSYFLPPDAAAARAVRDRQREALVLRARPEREGNAAPTRSGSAEHRTGRPNMVSELLYKTAGTLSVSPSLIAERWA